MMNKVKLLIEKYPKAFGFVVWILFYFLLSKVHELASTIFMVLATLVGLAYSLLTSYNYRRGKLGYVVFPAYNDDHSQFQSFFFSGALLVGLVIAYYAGYTTVFWSCACLFIILLLFFSALFNMPEGFLKVKSNKITLYGVPEAIEIEEINDIDVYHDRIVVRSQRGKIWLASNLKIDQAYAEKIASYLSTNLINHSVNINNQVIGN
ncbi:hypothetical protein [Pedobacter sp.]|uniref:hypothetical protein n=1 Tax=Pedobacter sp. TaxID=1411316 RepID=UPI0031D74071